MTEEREGEYCEVCNAFVSGFEYEMCCNGIGCGCMGKPVYPCVCSEECWDKLINGDDNSPKGIAWEKAK